MANTAYDVQLRLQEEERLRQAAQMARALEQHKAQKPPASNAVVFDMPAIPAAEPAPAAGVGGWFKENADALRILGGTVGAALGGKGSVAEALGNVAVQTGSHNQQATEAKRLDAQAAPPATTPEQAWLVQLLRDAANPGTTSSVKLGPAGLTYTMPAAKEGEPGTTAVKGWDSEDLVRILSGGGTATSPFGQPSAQQAPAVADGPRSGGIGLTPQFLSERLAEKFAREQAMLGRQLEQWKMQQKAPVDERTPQQKNYEYLKAQNFFKTPEEEERYWGTNAPVDMSAETIREAMKTPNDPASIAILRGKGSYLDPELESLQKDKLRSEVGMAKLKFDEAARNFSLTLPDGRSVPLNAEEAARWGIAQTDDNLIGQYHNDMLSRRAKRAPEIPYHEWLLPRLQAGSPFIDPRARARETAMGTAEAEVLTHSGSPKRWQEELDDVKKSLWYPVWAANPRDPNVRGVLKNMLKPVISNWLANLSKLPEAQGRHVVYGPAYFGVLDASGQNVQWMQKYPIPSWVAELLPPEEVMQ